MGTEMTPDLDEIRRVLAAATPRHPDIENADYDRLLSNALTWLAALCDEVERLRTLNSQLTRALHGQFVEEWVTATPDRALPPADTVPSEVAPILFAPTADMVAERDAALAEVERLRAELEAKS